MDSSSRVSHIQILLGADSLKEFVCYQEEANEHDRHAVAVHGVGDSNNVLGHLPREFS